MKKIAYTCCLGVIALLTTEFGVIGILPQVAVHYHISIGKAGLLLSLFALVVAVAGPFMTLITSALDRKKLLLTALLLFLASNFISLLLPPFWLLVLVRVIPAFMHPVYYATALGIVSSGSNQKDGYRMMALVLSGISISAVTTIPLATYIAGLLNWQASFVVQAIVSGLAAAGVYLVIPQLPPREKISYRNQLSVVLKRSFLVSTGAILLTIAAWFCTYSYFADFLMKSQHMSQATISYLLLLFGLTGVLGNWIAGKTMGKAPVITSLVSLSGILIVAGGFSLVDNSSSGTVLLVALWGGLYAPTFFISSAMITSAAPKAVEFANSIAASVTNLGITIGTTVGGWVIGNYGVTHLPWAGLCFGIGAAIMLMIRSVHKKARFPAFS